MAGSVALGEAAGTIATSGGKAIATVDTRHRPLYLLRMAIIPPTSDALSRIADALERLSPPPAAPTDLAGADAFVWQAAERRLVPVPRVNRVDLALLKGIDRS